jgi:hypothetical protein
MSEGVVGTFGHDYATFGLRRDPGTGGVSNSYRGETPCQSTGTTTVKSSLWSNGTPSEGQCSLLSTGPTDTPCPWQNISTPDTAGSSDESGSR